MTVHVKDGATWKVATPYVKDGATWKAVVECWVKDGATWKLAFSAGGSALDTQSVTIAQSGIAGSRKRGFLSPSLGSISDGTSNLFAGGAIVSMFFDEATGEFAMEINGSTNTGWTTLTNVTDGTTLTRAAASYSGDTWAWGGQALAGFFVGTSGTKVVEFS